MACDYSCNSDFAFSDFRAVALLSAGSELGCKASGQ